ncbi:MAG: hypothetical protein JWR80_704 [Bradyrhizobium sp.]|nr:hypothetical protein [Bradyrhizobium sp.]
MAMTGLRLASVRPEVVRVMAIKALAEPQTLSRITGLFAQFDLIPATFCCQRSGAYLCVDAQLDIADLPQVEKLLAKMRAMVVVERASLTDS